MANVNMGTREEWLAARIALLEKEKAHSKKRDALTRERQALPWVLIEKDYVFESVNGPVSLDSLFGNNSQLIIQHFMYDPAWKEGCKSCSFMADHMTPALVHINNRDTSFAAVSKAPIETISKYHERMGWDFAWVSSSENDFNRDFQVSFTHDELENDQCTYNFKENRSFSATEAPGLSSFAKDEHGNIYHTYSVFERGLENVMTAYDLLDMVPKGRDEDGKSMFWVKRHDEY